MISKTGFQIYRPVMDIGLAGPRHAPAVHFDRDVCSSAGEHERRRKDLPTWLAFCMQPRPCTQLSNEYLNHLTIASFSMRTSIDLAATLGMPTINYISDMDTMYA
jgi:hypothetical protein